MTRFCWLFAMALAIAAMPTLAVAQDTGTVAGSVVEAATQRPLAGVQVSVVGTRLGTLTNQEGRFLITNVPAGTQEVRATLIGYARGAEQVTVAPGATVTVNFTIRETAIELEGITVNPITGREERRRELGTNTATIQTADINPAVVTSFSDVLSARAPGVNVQQTAGTLGTSERIRIRGANSLNLSNEPLIYIDGVRASRSYGGLEVGGANPSRLNDLSPGDIENIEVLKGPAATAMYGTAAAAGVILISTKRGRTGPAQWNAFVELQQLEDITQYPANWLGLQVGDPDAPLMIDENHPLGETFWYGFPDWWAGHFECPVYEAAAGQCTIDEVVSFNTLMDSRTTPYRTGHRQRMGASVSGGVQGVNYYLSGEFEDGQGVIQHNQQDRASFRANLRADLHEAVTVNVTTGYTRHRLSLNNNDNSIFSPLLNGLMGAPWYVPYNYDSDVVGQGPDRRPAPFEDANYTFFGLSVDHLSVYPVHQEVDRFTVGVTSNYRPFAWLSANLNLGLDFVDRHDFSTLDGPDLLPIGGGWNLGFRESWRTNNYLWTGGLSSTATYRLTDDISSSTTIGTNMERTLLESTYCYGEAPVPGLRSCGATTLQFAVDEGFQEIVTIAGYLQQNFSFQDRLFLTASLRGDDDSNFGEGVNIAWFPGANLSWVASEETWFPTNGFVGDFRLRGAVGTSGMRPGFRQALTRLQPQASIVAGAPTAGVILSSLGNPDLRPERTTEFELGFDAGFVQDRVGIEFTYYNKTSQDAIIARRLWPSLGLTATVLENLGSVRNAGTELAANIRFLDMPGTRANLRLAHTTLRNEILDLGEGIEPIIFNRGNQRHDEGYPAGGFFQIPYEYDVPENGMLAIADIRLVTDDEGNVVDPEFIGPSMPTWSFTAGGDVSFMNNLITVSTLFEARGGNYQLNMTEEFRCTTGLAWGVTGCRAGWDPTAPVEDQARILGSMFLGTDHGFIEPADFVKWRELAVSLGMPPALRQRFAMLDGLTVTLAGRNLATWTDYTGLDPEINEGGGAVNFSQNEFNTQPPLRQFTARVNVAF
jgi:TonB-dependent starch-binding outer membrane protein SusC